MAENAEQMQLDVEDVNTNQAEAFRWILRSDGRPFEEDEHMETNDKSFIIDSAPFEIETYAAQFYCYGRILRLQFIAEHCPPLRIEALEHLISYVKGNTYNVPLYEELWKELNEELNKKEERQAERIDQEWIDKTNATAKLLTDKLESELKNYKTNSIKESIRRGYSDLAQHYITCGDLSNAQRCYFRSRDYCMVDQQTLMVYLAISRLSLYMKQKLQLQAFLTKTDMFSEIDRNNWAFSQLNCLNGISEMMNGGYKRAARYFFMSNFEHFAGENIGTVLSANCVAIYGTLCAMASYDRNDLKTLLFANPNFKLFLELEPQLREAAIQFYDSKYTQSLKLLADAEDAFRLDLYLSGQVSRLYSAIRSRALVLYFRPYMSANLEHMSAVFHTNLPQIESELLELIMQDKVKARIDSHRKILFAKDIDQRVSTFNRCLTISEEWCLQTVAAVLKAACIRHNSIYIREETPEDSSNGNGNVMSEIPPFDLIPPTYKPFVVSGPTKLSSHKPVSSEVEMDTSPSLDEIRARRIKSKCVKTTDSDQSDV